jgi:hypothetical protein
MTKLEFVKNLKTKLNEIPEYQSTQENKYGLREAKDLADWIFDVLKGEIKEKDHVLNQVLKLLEPFAISDKNLELIEKGKTLEELAILIKSKL